MSFSVFLFGGTHKVRVPYKVAIKHRKLQARKKQAEQRMEQHNPLATFFYPDSGTPWIDKQRNVRVIGANKDYLVGLEILPENKFQYKKFCKYKIRNFSLLEFNPSAVK